MFPLVCPKCETELQVPNSLAGCLIRCHECDTVTRAPRPEAADDASGTASYDVQAHQAAQPAANKEIQDFVKAVEKKAKEEAEKEPYRSKNMPIDLIIGIILVTGGLILMLRTMLGATGAGPMSGLIFGVLLPLILILAGAVFLRSYLF